MKIKANKILAVLCVIAMLMTMIVPMTLTATAAETATLSFANTAQRTSFSTSKQVWEQNGITLTNDKGSSTSNVANYANPARFYKSSKITIEAPGNITSIVFTCASSYASALKNSIGTAATVSGNNVTVTLDGSSNTYVIASLTGGQVRMNSLSVTYVTEAVECAHENTVTLEAKDATCSAEGLTEGEKCEDCGIIITPQESIAKIPHNFVDDVCSECGEIKPDTTLTIEQALEIGSKKEHNTYTEGKYYVAGVITEIYDTEYGNMKITDADGNILTIYGTYSADGSTRYDAMTTKPVVGDTVIIYGIIGQYNGTPQIKNGWIKEIVQDDATAEIRERLNAVQAYMQLAYKYTGTLETVEVPAVSTVLDTLNRATTGYTSGTSYYDWSGKTSSSGAVYAGNSAGGNSSIQLRAEKSSGIITTKSGGKAKIIRVVWDGNTANGRTLDVYGKDTAYESPSDLYDSAKQGTKLGSIVMGTSTELVIKGDYEYIAFRSNKSAMYLTSISIEWEVEGEGGAQEVEKLSNSQFVLKCGVDSSIEDFANIEGVTYGIRVTAEGGKTVDYANDGEFWLVDGDMSYVIIDLGDIINDKPKLTTVFTVRAYVVVGDITYYSELDATYSVADMVEKYYTEGTDEVKDQVKHLYGILFPDAAN